jgi:outer membrane protein assembly factor BamB
MHKMAYREGKLVNDRHQRFKQFFWLLQTSLWCVSLMLLLTACFGQPCPVGTPAPPHVALVVDQGVVYVSGYYSSNTYSAASYGLATMLHAGDGSRLGDTGEGKSFLGASDGILYLIDQQHVLQALRASDRSPVWQYQTGSVDGFVVDAGTIYLAAHDTAATVVALQASDGAVLWQSQPQGVVQQFTAGSGFVSFFIEGELVTLQASDGTRLWQQGFQGYAARSLKIAGDVLYIDDAEQSATFREVLALRVSDGTRLWQQSVQQGQQQLLAVGGGIAYLSITDTNYNQSLKALRASDGTLLWQKSLKDANGLTLLADADTLYLVFARQLSAWRTNDGSQLWQQQIHLLDGGYSYDLAASNGAVYLGVGGLFHHGSGCGVTDATYGVETVRASDGKLLWSSQR